MVGSRVSRVLRRWLLHRQALQHRQPPWVSGDTALRDLFLDTSTPEQKRYSTLFSYFVSGFLHYSTPGFARAYYPGAPSSNGAAIDGLEGFTRLLPLLSSWIASGRDPVAPTFDGHRINLPDVVRAGLVHGTDPASQEYWGHIHDYDQRIVEAADVALSLWLLQDTVWPQFAPSERDNIARWLSQVNGRDDYANNHLLFPIVVNQVLRSLGFSYDPALIEAHYARVKSFYGGSGWFSDGSGGVFDYYNAWGFHYALFWLGLMEPGFDPAFLDRSLAEFVASYRYLFSTDGFPFLGRSISYRMAAPAPLVAGALKGIETVSPGMARRALDCVWRHFVAKGAVSRGGVTQGYWREDLRFTDNYLGPASGLWSLRSLVLAFYCPWDSSFWTAPEEALPVEQGDYTIAVPDIGWQIVGCHETGEVKIVKMKRPDTPSRKADAFTFLRRTLAAVSGTPLRPMNRHIKYDLAEYSSLRPFCCEEDR
jgi:hypothetical protein